MVNNSYLSYSHSRPIYLHIVPKNRNPEKFCPKTSKLNLHKGMRLATTDKVSLHTKISLKYARIILKTCSFIETGLLFNKRRLLITQNKPRLNHHFWLSFIHTCCRILDKPTKQELCKRIAPQTNLNYMVLK